MENAEASIEKVAIVLFQGMGDVVLAIPAIKAIRSRFPGAELTVIGYPHSIRVLARERIADELLPIDMPVCIRAQGDMSRFNCTVKKIRQRRFDLLINLTTLLKFSTYAKCQLFNRLCRPRRVIGGRISDCLTLFPGRESVKFRNEIHETKMKLRMLARLGIDGGQIQDPCFEHVVHPRLGVTMEDARPEVGICAGGAKQTHRWPTERFVESVKLIQAKGIQTTLIGGAADAPISEVISQECGGQSIDLTGKVELEDLPRLISRFTVLLTNDTGPMHVAAAVGTPVVAIFGAGSPVRYAPLAPPRKCRIFYRRSECGPCLRNTCGHRSCMDWVDPSEVVSAVCQFLDQDFTKPVTVSLPVLKRS